MTKLTVGQKLWYVPNHRGDTAREVTVTKVGRRWANIEPGYGAKLDIQSFGVHGREYHHGDCYLSREAYEDETRRYAAWRDLQREIAHTSRVPRHLNSTAIREILAVIRGDAREMVAAKLREMDAKR